MANYKIYFKSNFNRLIMNVTQINFLYWQNVHLWYYESRSLRREEKSVVCSSAHINYSAHINSLKQKENFTDYNDKI